MNPIRPLPIGLFPAIASAILVAVMAHGQLELQNPQHFNHLTQGTALGAGHPQPDTQFSSVGVTSGSAGPIAGGYPQANDTLLKRAGAGNSFATGVPRYYLGDEILPPATEADNSSPAAPGYWRAKPVRPDETFSNPDGTDLLDVTGTQLPNTAGSTGTPIMTLLEGEYEKFYYSPHADRVFASQAGTVEIYWVSSSPEGTNGGAWQFRKETFNVSGAATGSVRKIYWTEKSFVGPRVNIPAGRVVRVNPVYNSNFPPEVAEEYVPVGHIENPDPNAQPAEEKRTLWFEKIAGNGQLAAYNIEGRLLVEYLGDEISPGKHEFLGADVVEVVRTAPAILVEVKVGHQILPDDGDASLIASPLLNLGGAEQDSFYGTLALADDTLVYHAERENLNPDRVVFYWLEDNDADVHLLPAPEVPGLSIRWPKYQNLYLFLWPEGLEEFAHVTTDPGGSSAETGLLFDAGSQPQIVFQDDGTQTESRFDVNTGRLILDLSESGDDWNRTLLKFTSGNGVWYQPIYSQAEDRDSFEEGDELPAIDIDARVGARIERPSERYSPAGAISGGTGYQASAYIDPYAAGVEAAEAGSIIPVNAPPTDNILTVRWFEKIEPPSPAFAVRCFDSRDIR